jgi:hypothetical protein
MKVKPKYYWMLFVICAVMTKCSSDPKSPATQVDSLTTITSDTTTKTKIVDIDSIKVSMISVSKNWLLIPGVSAGKTLLNKDSKQAFDLLGKADGGDAAMGKSVSIWYSNHDSTANSIAIYTVRDTGEAPAALIQQIRVTSSSFKTRQGVHCGSTLTALKKEYEVKETETYTDNGTNYRVFSSDKGIAFEIDPEDKCVAIIIFNAGKPLPGTYLKFRTTNKFINNKV